MDWLIPISVHMPEWQYMIVGAALVLIVLLSQPLSRSRSKRRKSGRKLHRHTRYQKYAMEHLERLAGIPNNPQRFGYLRTINPFVFEEMILAAYEKQGHRVIRNKRYTGDGGIDGKVMLGGHLHLIQAKRYRGHISRKDLVEFTQLCESQRSYGLFIHTGKTGKETRQYAHSGPVTVISGEQLIRLMCGNRYKADAACGTPAVSA